MHIVTDLPYPFRRPIDLCSLEQFDLDVYNLATDDPPAEGVDRLGYTGMWGLPSAGPLRKHCRGVIVDYSWECSTNPVWNTEKQKASGFHTRDVLWLLHRSHPRSKWTRKNTVIFWEFFAADTQRRADRGDFLLPPIGSCRTVNPLVLTAQLKDKPWRADLLRRLYHKGVLHTATVTTLGPGYTDRDPAFNRYLHSCTQEPVDRVEYWQDQGQGFARGWPADPSVYLGHRYSIVLETYACGGSFLGSSHVPDFVTEKTYRTILMGHPFLLQAEPGVFKYLRGLGFDLYHKPLDNEGLAQLALEWNSAGQGFWDQQYRRAEYNRMILQTVGRRERKRLGKAIERWRRTLR